MMLDIYPSRSSTVSSVIERKDPVVYSDWHSDAPLTKEQTQFYEQNGFLVLKNLLTDDEVQVLQSESERLQVYPEGLSHETLIVEPSSDELRSIFKIHDQSDIFRKLASDSRLLSIAKFLLNDELYIHQSRLNYKPAFAGKDFYWHSDFETWHVEDGMPRMRALSMSVLLTDNMPYNGPTMFMNQSHKRYISCIGETPEDHYKASLKKQEYGVPDHESLTELSTKGISAPTGPSGTVVFFDCNTMHGSNSNITPMARSNAFFVYNAISNKPVAPFGPATPRPEFIGARKEIKPLQETNETIT